MKRIIAILLAVLLLASAMVIPAAAAGADNSLPAVKNPRAKCETVGSTEVTITWDPLSESELAKVKDLQIDISPDNVNWYSCGFIDKNYNQTTEKTCNGYELESGKTYYLRLAYRSSNGHWNARTGKNIYDTGPETILSFQADDHTADVLKRFNTLKTIAADGTYKFTEKSTKYDRQKLVKGTKIIWTCPYYTVTFLVTAANAKKANYTATIKCAAGYEDYFFFDEGETTEKGSIVYADYYYKGVQDYKLRVYANTDGVYELYGYSRYSEYSDEVEKVKKLNADCPVYFVLSQKLKINAYDMKATQNSVSLGMTDGYSSTDRANRGTIVYYRVSGTSKWTKATFAAAKTSNVTIKKLKAGTTYEFKRQAYETVKHPLTGKKIKLTEDYAIIYKITTGSATAPAIKSVKVTSVKTGTSHTSGYWDYAGNYHPGRDDTFTKVTLTVTLKNRPETMKALQCPNAFDGGVSTGKGNTFTITFTLTGNQKGATKKLSFAGLSNSAKSDGQTYYFGQSKAAAVNVTLK